MKIKCWNCSEGRVKIRKITIADWIFGGFVAPALCWLMERDKADNDFWKDCPVCSGKGYQEDAIK